ncbi:hypothetical protein A606_04105 [Corynebacterium terpenotabidum Y-11]|uniref:Carboxylesterase type B domain-containing protein n=1 Tax=Corynebacterium terpenotabidum Y-11 TaxID=1200352 RepID=S4XFR4_9CORY|nr:hypothetical protein A606_04105 [Corynebacterium terpenotabidum Y-11]
MSVFRAVPVAETSDIGDPEPPTPWEGVLDCADTRERSMIQLPTTASVFAPADAEPASLPVFVWIHGGRYEEGHGDDGWYDGGALAALGCVVVTINHRLRYEGFLPLDGDAPGSFRGVDDLVHALRWIRETVAVVGGDPDWVTLAGQSAGGGLVMTLLADRRADDLFQQAMVLSPGLPRIHRILGWRARRAAARVFLGVPLTRDRVSALSARNRDLAYRRSAHLYFTDCALGPSFPDPAQLRQVPLLVSTMHDEFVRFPGVIDLDRMIDRRNLPVWVLALGMRWMGVRPRKLARWCRTVDQHRPMGQTVGEAMIRRWAAGLLEAAPGEDVWACEFRGGDWRGTRIDAQHCGELPVLFDKLTVGPDMVAAVCGPDAVERLTATGQRFRAAVLGFLGGDGPGWDRYGEARTTRIFDLTGGPDTEVDDPLRNVRTLLPV